MERRKEKDPLHAPDEPMGGDELPVEPEMDKGVQPQPGDDGTPATDPKKLS